MLLFTWHGIYLSNGFPCPLFSSSPCQDGGNECDDSDDDATDDVPSGGGLNYGNGCVEFGVLSPEFGVVRFLACAFRFFALL